MRTTVNSLLRKQDLRFIDLAMNANERSGKLSLTTCKLILNKKGFHYSDEQILMIRDWLYMLGEIMIDTVEAEKKTPKEK